jgi:hypothetical protein
MEIFPSQTQRLHPFDFYFSTRKNHPITYDEEYGVYGIFRYNDVRRCFLDFKNFSSDFTKWITNMDTTIQSTTKVQEATPFGPILISSDPPNPDTCATSFQRI